MTLSFSLWVRTPIVDVESLMKFLGRGERLRRTFGEGDSFRCSELFGTRWLGRCIF